MNNIGARFSEGHYVYVITNKNNYPIVSATSEGIMAQFISSLDDYIPFVEKAEIISGTLTVEMSGAKKIRYGVRFFPPPWAREKDRKGYEGTYYFDQDEVFTLSEALKKVEDIYEAQCASKKEYIMSLWRR